MARKKTILVDHKLLVVFQQLENQQFYSISHCYKLIKKNNPNHVWNAFGVRPTFRSGEYDLNEFSFYCANTKKNNFSPETNREL